MGTHLSGRILAVGAGLMVAVAAGCGGDGEPALTSAPAGHPILGTWVATSVTVVGAPAQGDAVTDLGLNFSFHFSQEGEYSYLATNDDPNDSWICEGTAFCEDWGTYRIDGSSIILDEGTPDEITYSFTISGNTLTMTDMAGGGYRIEAEQTS